MENAIVDLFQLNENSDMTVVASENKTNYVSCIKINGKPILPPLINEERRNELKKFKQKAIEIELRLIKQKKKSLNQISSEISSLATLPPSRQSTPARPISLNLHEEYPGQTYVLSKSRTEGSLDQYSGNIKSNFEINSSHKSSKNQLERAFKSTLEQRLATEENVLNKNKLNKYQQSPIIEEQFLEKSLDSEEDSKSKLGRWSPLKVEPLNTLRIELPNKDSQETDDNLEISQEDIQNTPETLTQSPSLMRQNSYTLLTPSPALLNFLESQKKNESAQRSQSGRKTWDLIRAKKNWNSNSREGCCQSLNGDGSSDEIDIRFLSKKNSSSLDDFSNLRKDFTTNAIYNAYSVENSGENDSGSESSESPDSYGTKRPFPKQLNIKIKSKGKRGRSSKSVPSPKANEKVPFDNSISTQGGKTPEFVPSEINSEFSELSNLFLKMKFDHERQKKELEEKQRTEMKQLEIIFQKKEAELLNRVHGMPHRKSKKSIYSLSSKGSATLEHDPRVMGDGNYGTEEESEKANFPEERLPRRYVEPKRPHSAKDFHQFYGYVDECNRRTKSVDFIEGNTQDTDLDVSFQDDFMQSRDTTLNNEYVVESDSISNFSSRSSTISSENRPNLIPVSAIKKFQEISAEEYAKYNQAATKITAVARGFLTRRLLRTAHVQGLITTLKDAIKCATQLHAASDIADSDIDLMRRLGRQIEAAWNAVYAVFFNTETSTKLQLIAADRERLKAANSKTPLENGKKKKRISSATRKSLDRKKIGSVMSKSETSNGSAARVRICSKMTGSYSSPYFQQKLK